MQYIIYTCVYLPKKLMVILDPIPWLIQLQCCFSFAMCAYHIWYGNAFRNVTSITIIVIAGKVYNIYIIAADIKW